MRWKDKSLESLYRIRAWAVEHQAFLLLLAAFTVFRLLAIVILRPGGFIVHQGPDQAYYFDMSRFTGSEQYPFFHFWMEYPPLMPWLATLAYRLSLHIPPWDVTIFWFNLIFRLLLLPFDVATLALVYKIGLLLGPRERALHVAGLWALLFAPLFTLLTWFDPLTLFFLVLGLYGLLTDRSALAGAALGLGLMAKVLPIAIWPVGLFALSSHRRRAIYVASTTLGVGLVVLPPLVAAPAYVLAMLRSLFSVSSWETVWSLLEGHPSYGLVAPLNVRHDPAAAVFSIHPSSLPWPLIGLIFAALYVLALTRRIAWQDKACRTRFALFSLTVFVLYNKGYSPQWASYLGTLALLALPTGHGLGYALLLSGYMILEWPLAFVMLAGQDWFLAAIIVLRTVLILLLSLDSLARALPSAATWRAVRRAAFPLALLTSLTAVPALAGPTWRAYAASRLAADPLAPFVASLPPAYAGAADALPSPVIVVQPELLERLRPYLPGETVRLFPNAWGDAWTAPDEWLTATLRSYDRAWLLYDDGDQPRRALYGDLRAWFETHACPASQAWYGPVWAGQYVLTPAPIGQAVEAAFENGLRLVGAAPPQEPLAWGSAFCLRLAWAADASPAKDYAIFVHLLAADGQLVAQGDAWPPRPTSAWTAGETIRTAHGLVLPPHLPTGDYALWVGLYALDDGARLPLLSGGDAVLLGKVAVESLAP